MWKRERRGYVILCWREPGSRKVWTKPEHVSVWEQAHGPKPDGFIVHHRNENKRDNRLANLELVSRVEHPMRHTPNVRKRRGRWERRCGVCKLWKPFADYAGRAGGRQRYCQPCATDKLRQWRAKNREHHAAYMR